ncbi:MAG: DUF58 domain-containing protein [Nanoarchaeota archaeon]
MIDLDYLKQLDRFSIVLKKRVISQYSGSRQSQSFGEGLIFRDYREYIPGDDFRSIDWKVYARTDKLYLRRYEEERNLKVHVVVDGSSSMDFGNPRKFDYAAQLAIGFAYMGMRNNEKFEISSFSDDLVVFTPKKGKSQLIGLLEFLSSMRVKGQSNLYQSLRAYKRIIHSKSLVIIISDFLYDIEQIRETLLMFKKSEVIVVQVLDMVEKDLDYQGQLILTDAENELKIKTFVSKRMQKDYRKRLLEHIYEIKDICDDMGATFISVTSNVPIFETFHYILTRT